jgi:hypothetical protein
MSERFCNKCKEPVVGHSGPTGRHCDWPYIPSGEGSDSEDEEQDSMAEKIVLTETQQLSAKIDLLAAAVEGLVTREKSRVVESGARPKEHPEVPIGGIIKKVTPQGDSDPPANPGVNGPGAGSDAIENISPALKSASTRVTPQSLRRDRELSVLLTEYNGNNPEDILHSEIRGGGSVGGIQRLGENNFKRVLLIPEFITHFEGIEEIAEDSFVSKEGNTFNLHSKSKRVTAKEVSIPQWISANNRICEILSVAFSPQDLKDYNRYTRQIGDLLQIYPAASVFLLDNAHRKDVFSYGARWHQIDNHLERFYLQKPSKFFDSQADAVVSSTSDNVGSNSSSGNTVSSGKSSNRKRWIHPCTKYNSKEGCQFKNGCRFPHICSERGCMGAHPVHEHKNFRSNSSGKSEGNG